MTKRKDGRYCETITIDGKRKYFYGKTKAEVLRQINQYRAEKAEGRTFAAVAEEWWEEHQKNIEYNTRKPYAPAVRRAIEYFGDKNIKDITPPQIARFVKKFSETHADKTTRTQLMIFNLIGAYAVEKGDLDANFARDLSVPSNLEKEIIDPPSSDDIQRVKDNVKHPFGLFAYMAMYTGMRRGELLALEWSDFDRENRTITINKSIYYDNNRPMTKEPKTRTSAGNVPILDALFAVLPQKCSGLVFPSPAGKLLRQHEFDRLWGEYCKETGITATPHQFRHCFATMLFEAGVPAKHAQVLLRHAQLSTTMDTYTAIRERKKKEIFESVYSVDIK